MEAARTDFLRWTARLLDAPASPGEQRAAAEAWCGWAMDRLEIDAAEIGAGNRQLAADSALATGTAISPQRAALCVREQRRTAVFLQAVAAAIRAAQARFPGETIHLVEAGCGPLAPLALPFAARYPAHALKVTLLDFHPAALAGARQLAEELGVVGSLHRMIAGDAAAVRFAETERPHIVVCEVLNRALGGEPQVAVTRALAPQVRPGGFFLPERIDVVAALVHGGRRTRRMLGDETGGSDAVRELGPAFSAVAATLHGLPADARGRLPGGTVRVPAHDPAEWHAELLTRLAVHGGYTLGDFDCSLTLPVPLPLPVGLAATGGELDFAYEMSVRPGVRVAATRP